MHHGKITKTIAKGLRVLKTRIERGNVPPSQLDETINIATWSIREFGPRPRRPRGRLRHPSSLGGGARSSKL